MKVRFFFRKSGVDFSIERVFETLILSLKSENDIGN